MKRLIPQFGNACLQSRGDAFTTLARSIVGQQISVKAAQSVWEKFAALPDETVVAWHRSGWLALVHHHLSSLARFSALVNRQSQVPAEA